MLVTYTRNGSGLERVYLGSRASIEVWIEPEDTTWSVRCLVDETLTYIDDAQLEAIVEERLAQLAQRMNIERPALDGTPFAAIAALHTDFNFANKRTPMSRKLLLRQGGFVAQKPSSEPPPESADSSGFQPVRRAQR